LEMTELAIVAYPALDAVDRQWIEGMRAERDPVAARVAVHFTVVFPVEAPLDEVVLEVATVTASTEPIRFVIRRAEAVPDRAGARVFLVPDEGTAEIVTLHDRLYNGVLRPHLRTDIPYVPHMTVAADRRLEPCAAWAQELNQTQRTIRGLLRSVDIVDVATTPVRSVYVGILGRCTLQTTLGATPLAVPPVD
jgi:2'-5' RNA ligase